MNRNALVSLIPTAFICVVFAFVSQLNLQQSILGTKQRGSRQMKIEAFHGLSFWERYGDVPDVLQARVKATPDSLVSKFQYFAPEFLEFGTTFCLTDDGNVAALAGCTKVEENGTSIALQYLTVAAEYRGLGFASKLVKSICSFMAAGGLTELECSRYSELGLGRLRHVLARECAVIGARLTDSDRIE
jgi:GNAT superfamily N-acetyltransferase